MCCLFGFIDYNHNLSGKQKNRLLRSLASAAEEHGTDAAGIAYHAGGKLHIMKKAKPAHVLRFRIPLETSVVIRHTGGCQESIQRASLPRSDWRQKVCAGPQRRAPE